MFAFSNRSGLEMHLVNATLPPAPPTTPEPGVPRLEADMEIPGLIQSQLDTDLSRALWNPDTALGNASWKLGSVPADEIETSTFGWYKVKTRSWIHVFEKVHNDESYEVAVNLSSLLWLAFHGLELNLDYNPTKPTQKDISIHGTWEEATRRARDRFLRNAVSAIHLESSQGYQECFRDIARLYNLEIPLERAILKNDILESGPHVRKIFAQCFLFLVLNLLRSYDSHQALELLAKSQDDLLEPFYQSHTLENQAPIDTLEDSDRQTIFLGRSLLEFCGGREEVRQHTLDQGFTTSDNLHLYGLLIGITGTNRFGDFDPDQMHETLLKSKVFSEDKDISPLNTVKWTLTMMHLLPIGFEEEYLNVSSRVLSSLSLKQVHLFRMHLEQTYNQFPSLRKPENDVLLLLTWSSTAHGPPLQVLSEWVDSCEGWTLFQRMIEGYQKPQSLQQLALTLLALLCLERLLPYTPKDTDQPINGSYLADLNAILNDQPLSNRRKVFEWTNFSFLRVLDTLEDKHEDISQLLEDTLATREPLPDRLDGCCDQYLAYRIDYRLNHKMAFELVKHLPLMGSMWKNSIDDDDWVLVSNSTPVISKEQAELKT